MQIWAINLFTPTLGPYGLSREVFKYYFSFNKHNSVKTPGTADHALNAFEVFIQFRFEILFCINMHLRITLNIDLNPTLTYLRIGRISRIGLHLSFMFQFPYIHCSFFFYSFSCDLPFLSSPQNNNNNK